MNLNAPDLNCPFCKGTGLRVRDVRFVMNNQVARSAAKAALHCGCLSPELKELHAALDNENIFKTWPWDELKGIVPPRAKDGPEPALLGNPFPIGFVPTKPQLAKEPAPEMKEPAPAKPRKRQGRSKHKS
jgi:hypothetical protein